MYSLNLDMIALAQDIFYNFVDEIILSAAFGTLYTGRKIYTNLLAAPVSTFATSTSFSVSVISLSTVLITFLPT